MDWRVVHFLTRLTPTTQATVFADNSRLGQDIHLLSNPWILVGQRDSRTAIGTAVIVVLEEVIDLGLIKRLTFVARVSRLTTTFAFALLLSGAARFRWFGDVAGRRLRSCPNSSWP